MKRWIRSVHESIYAHAANLNALKHKLTDISPELLEHLVKYYCADENNSNLSHWVTEIYSLIHDVPKSKNSKKFPKYNMLYDALYIWYKERVHDNYRLICKREHLSFPEDLEQLEKFVNSYCRWLCYELSTVGHVNLTAVRNQLDSYKHDALNYFI